MTQQAVDMAGKKYANLTALEQVGRQKNGNLVWRFRCDCGRMCEFDGYRVRIGRSTTCQDCAAERTRLASVTHGMSNSPEFRIWTDMQTRCCNSKSKHFKHYGARGIKICPRWLDSFEAFYKDMGPRPSADLSIERDDVNGDYELSNCRWATAVEQGRNRRNNHRIEIDGRTQTITEWAIEAGTTHKAIYRRLKAGLSGEQLLIAKRRSNGTLTFNGHTDTYAGWSNRTGIKESTIAMRLSKKWSIENTLTKGARL